MNKRFLRGVVVGLLLSFGFNTVSFGFFWRKKKQTATEKLLSSAKEAAGKVKAKFDKLKSNKFARKAASSAAVAAVIYFIQLLAFTLMEDDFDDADPRFKRMLNQMAREIGIHNPERIKLKTTKIRQKDKTFKRKALELVCLVPLFRWMIKDTLGCTGPAGNIYVSPKMLENEARVRFVLGHELSHIKHKDVVSGLISNVAFNVVLGECLGGRLGYEMAMTVSKILHSQIVGKFFEVRADLTSASLGKDVAQAGIEAFEEFQAKENRELSKLKPAAREKKVIKKMLFDPHPSSWLRAKYLGWYKDWKYSEREVLVH